ncbi:MAG: polysaccharide biosynthesis tyrosine autokinase [Deltaproteobacteria bacterium]|nr:MAG: polysaccharide biosynthesis tyrosine autokinase [Deltaproteobacteria bacterium]
MKGSTDMTENHQPLAPYLMRPPRRWDATLPPENEGGFVQDILGLLRRRWQIIAKTAGALFTLTLLYCVLATPAYLGSANVLIEGKGPEVLSGQDANAAQSPFNIPASLGSKYDYYLTQFTLLQSPSLVRRVIEEQGLAKNAAHWQVSYLPSWVKIPSFLHVAPPPNPDNGTGVPAPVVSQYLKQLTILPVRGTRLVSVQFTTPDPKLSAAVANAHAQLFVKAGLERLYESMDQIRTFLQTKLAELQTRMQEAETKLMKFQAAHNLLPVVLQKDVASERLMDLSKRLTEAQGQLFALEAEYQIVERGNYDSLPAVLHSPLIQNLRENYDRLEVEHALLALKFRPTYPPLRQLSGQLDHAHKLLEQETAKVVKGVEAKYLASKATTEQLKNELEAQRKSLLARKDVEGEFLALTSEVETTKALHDNLLARIKDLNVAGQSSLSNITVAEPAVAPQWPSFPATKLFLILSAVTGLLLGTGIAFLRESSDLTIRDARDIHRATGLGTLAVVPNFDGVLGERNARLRRALGAAAGLVRFGSGNGHTNGNGHAPPPAEAYRTLRTALLLSRAISPRVILVSSATGAEGKTTTAVNMAAALATCGAKVLLVDADLRQPRCHTTLGVAPSPGLGDYLTGRVAEEPIQTTHVENLSLLAAGHPAPNPTELLTSWLMCKLLQDARERFEFVVLDSPPVLAVSDALLLANLADGVVFVAESGRSRQDDARLAIERVLQTGGVPVGVVLNRGRGDEGYYRYYSNGPAARTADEILPPPARDQEKA